MNFFKPAPYQQPLLDMITSVPEGYTLGFWTGYRRRYAIATHPTAQTLIWIEGKWHEQKPSPVEPIKLRGYTCDTIIIDERESYSYDAVGV